MNNKWMDWMLKKLEEAKKKYQRREKRKVKRKLLKKHQADIERRLALVNYYYKLEDKNARAPKTAVCNKFDIDYKTFNFWLKRYEENNRSAFAIIDLSKRPKNIKFKLPFWAGVLIVLCRAIKGIGAESLAAEFKHRRIFNISHQGVHNIFMRYGLNHIKRLKKKPVQRYERGAPNELWHIDIKVPFWIKGVGKIYTIGIIGDYSHYAGIRPRRSMSLAKVRKKKMSVAARLEKKKKGGYLKGCYERLKVLKNFLGMRKFGNGIMDMVGVGWLRVGIRFLSEFFLRIFIVSGLRI